MARDGQSERQCNVLHRLSHGSVQKPANTEVPPPADPAATGAREGGYGNPAGPRPAGRTRKRAFGARGRPGLARSAFFSLKKKTKKKTFCCSGAARLLRVKGKAVYYSYGASSNFKWKRRSGEGRGREGKLIFKFPSLSLHCRHTVPSKQEEKRRSLHFNFSKQRGHSQLSL